MAYNQCLIIVVVMTLTLKGLAQTPSAPAPGPPGPINLTGILERGGQFSTLIQFLRDTQVGNQMTSQINSSTEGMTLFAPTDNAFMNLPAGTLNRLSNQQQIQLMQCHVLPRYYSLAKLVTVPNPVRTQASGQDGEVFGLNFTGQGSQVNVSTGIVTTVVNNELREDFPLAVYQVDKVLLPIEFNQTRPPSSAPPHAPPPTVNSTRNNSTTPTAEAQADAPSGGSSLLHMSLLPALFFFSISLFF